MKRLENKYCKIFFGACPYRGTGLSVTSPRLFLAAGFPLLSLAPLSNFFYKLSEIHLFYKIAK
jgi:hypothetical protein